QGKSRIGLRRGELEVEEDMPHPALVLEPGNKFLEHRRRHRCRRLPAGAGSRLRLATDVTAAGLECYEREPADPAAPWRDQRRHLGHVEESLATELASQRDRIVRVGIMPQNEAIVLGDADIGLNRVGAQLNGFGKRGNGVLWGKHRGTAVRDEVKMVWQRPAGGRTHHPQMARLMRCSGFAYPR